MINVPSFIPVYVIPYLNVAGSVIPRPSCPLDGENTFRRFRPYLAPLVTRFLLFLLNLQERSSSTQYRCFNDPFLVQILIAINSKLAALDGLRATTISCRSILFDFVLMAFVYRILASCYSLPDSGFFQPSLEWGKCQFVDNTHCKVANKVWAVQLGHSTW